MRVVLVDWGLSERVGDTLYLNRALKLVEWRDLYDWIMVHELCHSSGRLTLHDIGLDFTDWGSPMVGRLMQFLKKYPRGWVHFLCVSRREGEWYVDYGNLVLNVVGPVLLGIVLTILWMVLT